MKRLSSSRSTVRSPSLLPFPPSLTLLYIELTSLFFFTEPSPLSIPPMLLSSSVRHDATPQA